MSDMLADDLRLALVMLTSTIESLFEYVRVLLSPFGKGIKVLWLFTIPFAESADCLRLPAQLHMLFSLDLLLG